MNNIMTIDVEDWYNSSLDLFKDTTVKHGAKPDHSVVDNTLFTLELLAKTNNKATFFVLGTVAEYYPDLVREMLTQGHEVASHGYAHDLIYNLSQSEFEDDLKIAMEHLTNAGCSDVIGYRAPYWSITKKSLWALDVLQKLGFKYDSSIFPIKRGLYGIPDAKTDIHEIKPGFWELPPATIRLPGLNIPIAGGGYLRLAPYRIITAAIRKSNQQQTKVFYFHPYELDPTDTKLKHKVRSITSVLYWMQQKVGRKSNPEKLKRLLTEYSFTSIKQHLSPEVG